MPTTKREQFKLMWNMGMPYAAMAAALGVTKRALYQWRIELGIPARPRGNKPL